MELDHNARHEQDLMISHIGNANAHVQVQTRWHHKNVQAVKKKALVSDYSHYNCNFTSRAYHR